MSSLSICRMVEGCYPRQNAIPEGREVIFPIGDCAHGGQSSRMVVREGSGPRLTLLTLHMRRGRRDSGALCSIPNIVVSRDPGLISFIT